MYSSCIWHLIKDSFTTEKKKRKKVLEVKRGHTVLPPSNHLVNHICVCVYRSLFLSYLTLRILVSPRSQQQLHSCGATTVRGQNECSVASLTTEGEGGTHTIVAKREEGRRREANRGK